MLETKYLSTRIVSHFLFHFGIEVDDLLACPTDTVPRTFLHGKAVTVLSLSCANFFPLSSALEAA